MDNANYNPVLLPYLLKTGAFRHRPFTLLDIGCSGGLDPLWRLFGTRLMAHGFDPQQGEVARLRTAEQHPGIHYHANLVGLPDDHPFKVLEREEKPSIPRYYDTWWRSSAAKAASIQSRFTQQSNPVHEQLTPAKVGVDEFVAGAGLAAVDFLKIDTDGADLEVLHSSVRTLAESGVLGVHIESNFTGSHHRTANAWHNVDRFLKERGFMLYSFSTARFSRAALPARFVYGICAQTISGPPIQGDFIYLLDGAASDFAKVRDTPLDADQILRLACLHELFQVPDCAVELLLAQRSVLEPSWPVDPLLDLLTPPLDGRQVTYAEYMARFLAAPQIMFPAPR